MRQRQAALGPTDARLTKQPVGSLVPPQGHRVWLPYVQAESGIDIYTELLADGLTGAGQTSVRQPLDHALQYQPWRLKQIRPPAGSTLTLANSWNGFAFRQHSRRLVVVEHLFLFDDALRGAKTIPQRAFHEMLVRRWERRSMAVADAVVAVSQYTARQMQNVMGLDNVHVIHNGVDTTLFSPSSGPRWSGLGRRFRLLFVGNLTRRKGADLLPKILAMLGPNYELAYTLGREHKARRLDGPNLHCLGQLDREQVRDAYRYADLVVCPSRLEGFGYTPVEAMACGTPAVATRGSSLAELFNDGVHGRLCTQDDPAAFAAAIRELSADPSRLQQMGKAARRWVEKRFSLERMTQRYLDLFDALNDRPDIGRRR